MNLTRNTPRPSLARRAALASCALILCATACTGALALRTTVVPHAAAPLADPVRVQGGVMAGALLSHVNPVYPQAARDAHIQGSVVLHAIIARDGVIDKLTVVSGPPELTGSALDAVRQWVYRPYLLNGEPTEVDTTITVNYMLGR